MSMQKIHGVYLADTARVVGEVALGVDVNLWYGAVIRGDVAPVTVGAGTNVQDQAVIHCDAGRANTIGAAVTIGHGAIVHGVFVGDGAMIGMGARLLGGTRVESGSIVAAGALLPEGMVVPEGMVAMGIPARIARPVTDREKQYLLDIPPRYIEYAKLHCAGKDPRVRPWGQ